MWTAWSDRAMFASTCWFKKVQAFLPWTFDEEYLISLALKSRLSDRIDVNKWHTCSAAINKVLRKSTKINLFYNEIQISNEWDHVSEQSDSELWRLLTKGNVDNDEKN